MNPMYYVANRYKSSIVALLARENFAVNQLGESSLHSRDYDVDVVGAGLTVSDVIRILGVETANGEIKAWPTDSYQTVLRCLNELHKAGFVYKQYFGSKTTLWRLPSLEEQMNRLLRRWEEEQERIALHKQREQEKKQTLAVTLTEEYRKELVQFMDGYAAFKQNAKENGKILSPFEEHEYSCKRIETLHSLLTRTNDARADVEMTPIESM